VNQGIVFNIQKYSVHDGPGIRTTVFLKGCPLHCFWCQNPESQEMKPEILLDRSKCIACKGCIEVCPAGANLVQNGRMTLIREKCLGCGKCAEVCLGEARKLVGKSMTVTEVTAEILRDKLFYKNSGGGVTFSGGEPFMQAGFVGQLLSRSKAEGLHTAVDTCGYVPWETMKPMIKHTDLVLFDIKCLDAEKHRKATGVPNARIIENAKRVSEAVETWIRVPLIPGFNDAEQDIEILVNYVRKEIGPLKIELNPYNNLGEGKYARLDKSCICREPQPEAVLARLRAIYK